MEKKPSFKKIFTKKTIDYTYTILFLIIFSFFIFFVIRPNLLSIFQANKKIDDLRRDNNFLEKQVQNLVSIQSSLEANRDDISVLGEAISKMPQVNKLLEDLNSSIKDNNLVIDKLTIVDINLKKSQKEDTLKSVVFNVILKGSFDDFVKLTKDLYSQRRIKMVQSAVIGRDTKESSTSGLLNVEMNIEGYYL